MKNDFRIRRNKKKRKGSEKTFAKHQNSERRQTSDRSGNGICVKKFLLANRSLKG